MFKYHSINYFFNLKEKLINKWNQYSRKKRWWTIIFDFILLALIVVMLIPSARKNFSVFVIRNTLLTPYETSKTIILTEEDKNIFLTDNYGNKKNLSEYQNKPILINFWATWCPPCIAELPSLTKLYNKYHESIYFLFIVNEPFETVNKYLEKFNYNIPCYSIAGTSSNLFETAIIPTTFIINKEKVIVHKTGAARWDSGKIVRILDKLIEDN